MLKAQSPLQIATMPKVKISHSKIETKFRCKSDARMEAYSFFPETDLYFEGTVRESQHLPKKDKRIGIL